MGEAASDPNFLIGAYSKVKLLNRRLKHAFEITTVLIGLKLIFI